MLTINAVTIPFFIKSFILIMISPFIFDNSIVTVSLYKIYKLNFVFIGFSCDFVSHILLFRPNLLW